MNQNEVITKTPVIAKIIANAMYAFQVQNFFGILPAQPKIDDITINSNGYSGWEVDEYEAHVKMTAEKAGAKAENNLDCSECPYVNPDGSPCSDSAICGDTVFDENYRRAVENACAAKDK
jgi:hypothetical protein